MDIFTEDLPQIAFYFTPVDQEFAKFLVTLDEVVKWYVAWENILQEKEEQIDYCWEYIKYNKTYLEKLGFSRYAKLMDVLSDLWEYKDELFTLLGKEEPFNYLVILQNTNEKRPNGGFFWSFAFITLDGGRMTNLEIVDSYYPDFIAYRTRILAPSWTSVFLPDRKIWYIAGNKFWFTDVDGKNLKDLYEKMFNETYDMKKVKQTMEPDLYEKLLHQYIKGVFFVKSDVIENIIPWFREKVWEWQFVNAAVDLIRWEIRGNKKELYIKEVKDFFSKNSFSILKNVVNNFDIMLQEQFINVYASNISTWFDAALKANHLQNVFREWYIYAWDTNVSYNKVDGFIDKNIQIENEDWNVVLDSSYDIIDISGLSSWSYMMNILYTLNVPQHYMSFISDLETKYELELTERELGILAVQPAKYDDPQNGKVYKWLETKSTIYFPNNIKILDLEGEVYSRSKFYPDFANGVYYLLGTNVNNTTRNVKIKFQIN